MAFTHYVALHVLHSPQRSWATDVESAKSKKEGPFEGQNYQLFGDLGVKGKVVSCKRYHQWRIWQSLLALGQGILGLLME